MSSWWLSRRCAPAWTCAGHSGAWCAIAAPVQVVLDDGGSLTGTLDRVGVDHVELAVHPTDVPRRSESVREVRAVVLDAVAVVRTLTPGLG